MVHQGTVFAKTKFMKFSTFYKHFSKINEKKKKEKVNHKFISTEIPIEKSYFIYRDVPRLLENPLKLRFFGSGVRRQKYRPTLI